MRSEMQTNIHNFKNYEYVSLFYRDNYIIYIKI